MKSINWVLLLIISFVVFGCRKDKAKSYSGQLLLSKKFPTPVANRKIEMYQINSGPVGGSSLYATTVTDPNGYFRVGFAREKGISVVIPNTNSNMLVLRSPTDDPTFPGFYRENFDDAVYDPSRPIYIGKTIDTVIFKVSLLSDLAPTDTIGLLGNTVAGTLEKEYTGKSGSAGSVIVLDTIANVLFTLYDYSQRKYINFIFGGKKHATYKGHLTILPSARSLPIDFPETDEAKQEITIFFKR